jgi:K+-transporting ATPase ATPase B chain
MEKRNLSRLFTMKIVIQALKDSFIKLNPALLVKNPVIFIVGIGALITTVVVLNDVFNSHFSIFDFQIMIWLWVTALFANFSEAIAEGRGKAQADSLRKSRTLRNLERVILSFAMQVILFRRMGMS